MDWLANTAARRTDPQVLWPDARAVIMLGLNYGPNDDPLRILQHKDRGAISVYAQGDDYHDIIKSRLKTIARWLIGRGVDEHLHVAARRADQPACDGKAARRRRG